MVEVFSGLRGKIYFGTTINVTALMLSFTGIDQRSPLYINQFQILTQSSFTTLILNATFTEMVADQNGNFVTRLSIAKTCVPVFYYKFVIVL